MDLIPLVGLGTAGLGSGTYSSVTNALEAGIRLIDSAQAHEWYNEKEAGKAIADYFRDPEKLNERPIILTKIHPRSFSKDKMQAKLYESQQYFDPFGIDVVLLHSPWCWQGSCSTEEEGIGWQTGFSNLQTIKQQFGIKWIGVSNFGPELLNELINANPGAVDIVQNWMDPFHQDRRVRELCEQHGIQYMGYSSFGTQWNRNPNPVFTSPVLQGIASKHSRLGGNVKSVSVAQIVMAWLFQENVVAIPRSRNNVHMNENFAEYIAMQNQRQQCVDMQACSNPLTDMLVLDEEDMASIRALDGTLGTPWD